MIWRVPVVKGDTFDAIEALVAGIHDIKKFVGGIVC